LLTNCLQQLRVGLFSSEEFMDNLLYISDSGL
jgi:hypothetical protein